jgi:hypothetical protein
MDGTNENWAFFINRHGRYTHFVITPNGIRTRIDSPDEAFDAGTWHFTAGTYDGSRVRTYIDGKLVMEQAVSGDLTPNDKSFRIGHREWSSHWWMGMLDEVAVFNRALSEDEINTIMEKGLKGAMSADGDFAALQALIEDMAIHRGVRKSLLAKVDAAFSAFQRGKLHAATNMLNAFINEVEAQRGKKLTGHQVDKLTMYAGEIISTLAADATPARQRRLSTVWGKMKEI